MNVGDFLKVWLKGDDWAIVSSAEESTIDAAVSQWVDSGRTKDTVLHLERVDGDIYRVLASSITSWIVSTPAGRLRDYEWDKAAKDEADELKQQAGIADWDGDT